MNHAYDGDSVLATLKNVGANECENLFIHSDIMFGPVPKDFKRKEYLRILFEVLNDLKVKNIIVPTFSYSFCNHEVYDVRETKTSMGALNEYIRKMPNRYRTMDPLLSISVPECLASKFEIISNHSLGGGSGLDLVHSLDDVKFLFFGVPMGNCFTYLHYIEKMLDVPYRFDLSFDGDIIDYDGKKYNSTQTIHTACYGVLPKDFYHFEDYLVDNNMMKREKLGDKFVECIDEPTVYDEICKMIANDIHYFLERPFTEKDLEHRYTKGLNGERITHC